MRLLRLSRSPLNADRNGMRLKSRSISCGGLPSIQAVRTLLSGRRVLDPLAALGLLVRRRSQRHRRDQPQGSGQLGQLGRGCRRNLVIHNIFHRKLSGLVHLAAFDQALHVEQRIPDRPVRRRSLAQGGLGLFEHSLGCEGPCASSIGLGERVTPFRSGILLDKPLE